MKCKCPHCFRELPNDSKITVKVPTSWKHLLELVAEQESLTTSAVVRGLIRNYLIELGILPFLTNI